MIDDEYEKEKKSFEMLIQSLNFQDANIYSKQDAICVDGGISQDTWNFGVSLGEFKCSNKAE